MSDGLFYPSSRSRPLHVHHVATWLMLRVVLITVFTAPSTLAQTQDKAAPYDMDTPHRTYTSMDENLTEMEDIDGAALRPIVWMAPFFSGGGYSSEAISFAMSLFRVPNIEIAIDQHGDSFSEKFVNGLDSHTNNILARFFYNRVDIDNAIIICHSEPGAWYPAFYQTSKCPPNAGGVDNTENKANAVWIGRTMFETDRLPANWDARLNNMDYVWVPTQFHKKVFQDGGVDPDKIVVIPEPVDVNFFSPATARREPFSLDQGRSIFSSSRLSSYQAEPTDLDNTHIPKFVFLSIFKWEERKGWQFLLEAFLSEFSKDDDVGLYILTNAYHTNDDFDQKMINFIEEHPTIREKSEEDYPPVYLLPPGIDNTAIPGLYAAADCFVLPSRGEGWGRPHVEAMSMGLPVIATHWSGPSEYMTTENSYPLSHEGFDEIQEGAFRGHKWARPSVTHLRELMRHVYEHPDQAKQIGKQARIDMQTKYCPLCVATIVYRELHRLSQDYLI